MDTTIDKSNVRRVIMEEPTQFAEGLAIAKDVRVQGDFDSVMLSAMGGSALPGNILRIYLNDIFRRNVNQKRIQVYQNRFYTLPPESYHKCLNIFDSFSGDTEETVASFEEALHHKLPSVGVAGGGIIEQMCTKYHVPFARLPFPYEGFQPRMALGYAFSALVQILVNAGMIKDCTNEVRGLQDSLQTSMDEMETRGKALAKKLSGKTPIIYASAKFKALAMIFKIKINENAKTPAFYNFFPELNHNEMVGFTNPQADFSFVLLRDPDDHPQNLKRYDVLQRIFIEKGLPVETYDLIGKSAIEKTFASFLFADWTSYYLALGYKQDPTPIDMVEDFKKML
ncbi:MAG TPA: SIS domain-containing protein [Patescibacteria group bacterium]|nr:SIS domain-containing protein [Patescibacteria group bacterium]